MDGRVAGDKVNLKGTSLEIDHNCATEDADCCSRLSRCAQRSTGVSCSSDIASFRQRDRSAMDVVGDEYKFTRSSTGSMTQ